MKSGQPEIFGVVGNPVAHSLSPVMHNHAFRELALYREDLPEREKIILLTQADTRPPEEIAELLAEAKAHPVFANRKVLAVSAVTGAGIDEFKKALIASLPAPEPAAPKPPLDDLPGPDPATEEP